jgi:hypothetical protein
MRRRERLPGEGVPNTSASLQELLASFTPEAREAIMAHARQELGRQLADEPVAVCEDDGAGRLQIVQEEHLERTAARVVFLVQRADIATEAAVRLARTAARLQQLCDDSPSVAARLSHENKTLKRKLEDMRALLNATGKSRRMAS